MTSERVERRLTAILAADVAGYSRLMGADEEETLARLKAPENGVETIGPANLLLAADQRPCFPFSKRLVARPVRQLGCGMEIQRQ